MGWKDDSMLTFFQNRLLKKVDKRLGFVRQRFHGFKALGN